MAKWLAGQTAVLRCEFEHHMNAGFQYQIISKLDTKMCILLFYKLQGIIWFQQKNIIIINYMTNQLTEIQSWGLANN